MESQAWIDNASVMLMIVNSKDFLFPFVLSLLLLLFLFLFFIFLFPLSFFLMYICDL